MEVLCADHLQVVVEAVEIVQMQIIIVMLDLVHQSATFLIVGQEYVVESLIDWTVEQPSVVCVMHQLEKHVMKQVERALSANLIV